MLSRQRAGRGRRWWPRVRLTGEPGVLPAHPLGTLVVVSLLLVPWGGSRRPAGWIAGSAEVTPPQPTQMPMSDRLAEPVMPESPTQVDTGRSLYYFHCMPCHGDRGQGLTEEWRLAWVDDHQNCWARGCHTGKPELTSFYIPRSVPAVSGSPEALGHFQTAEQLFTFLRETQPPQRPGALSDSEYWALTAFLLHENGRLSPNVEIGPKAAGHVAWKVGILVAALALLLALFAAWWLRKRRCKTTA